MKIEILSDIHGNIDGLNAVLEDAGKVDEIICAGDLTGYYPFVNEVIETVKKKKIRTIRGNHDWYLVSGKYPESTNEGVRASVEAMNGYISPENLAYLGTLPESLELDIDGIRVLVYHGSPWDSMEGRVYPDFPDFEKFNEIKADVVILGQTHHPITRQIGDLTLINPGSCGQPRDYNELSYTLWDTEKNTFETRRIKWDIQGFIEKARAQGTPEEYFKIFERVKK